MIKKHTHILLYWLFVGWWIWIFKIFLIPFRLLFGHTKKVGKVTTISGEKTINKTKATCQNCGHCWDV